MNNTKNYLELQKELCTDYKLYFRMRQIIGRKKGDQFALKQKKVALKARGIIPFARQPNELINIFVTHK